MLHLEASCNAFAELHPCRPIPLLSVKRATLSSMYQVSFQASGSRQAHTLRSAELASLSWRSLWMPAAPGHCACAGHCRSAGFGACTGRSQPPGPAHEPLDSSIVKDCAVQRCTSSLQTPGKDAAGLQTLHVRWSGFVLKANDKSEPWLDMSLASFKALPIVMT